MKDFNPDDVFGINQYEGQTADGRQVYGIRGRGETYTRFWKEFRYKVRWEKDDWPWSYIALEEQDELEFREKWKEYITFSEKRKGETDYDAVRDAPAIDPQDAAVELELRKILGEEIEKEINKSIIDTICKNARA